MDTCLWHLFFQILLVSFCLAHVSSSHNSSSLDTSIEKASLSSNSSMHAASSVVVPPASASSPYILTSRFSPSMAIIVVVLLSALLFMGFFSVYVRRCTTDDQLSTSSSYTRNLHSPHFNLPSPSDNFAPSVAAPKGLDPSLVHGLPLLHFSSLTEGRHETMECVVCLKDFEDDEALRLLPECGHCFHRDCIDMWLFSHTTCPLCRRSLLDDQSHDREVQNRSSSMDPGASSSTAEVAIDIHDSAAGTPTIALQPRDISCSQSSSPILGVRDQTPTGPKRRICSTSRHRELQRSHSTGHSLVLNGATNQANLLITSPACSESRTEAPCSPLLLAITSNFHRSRSYALLSDLQGTAQHEEAFDQQQTDTRFSIRRFKRECSEVGESSNCEPISTTKSSTPSSSIRRALKRLAGMDANVVSFLSEHKSEATTQSVHVL